MKKLLAVLLAMCLTLSMLVTATAAQETGEQLASDAGVPDGTPELPAYAPESEDALHADAYVISTAESLQSLAAWVNEGAQSFAGKTVYLAGNVDLGGVAFTPIGTAAAEFAGTFDGLGNTIDNMRLTGGVGEKPAIGLFGYVNGATIRNLQIGAGSAVTFTGNASACEGIAAVIGYAAAVTVEYVSSAANVASNDQATAGIIGNLAGGASAVRYCTNTGRIDAAANSGGIIGTVNGNDGVIVEYCRNEGEVSNTITNNCDRIGGIVGTCNIAADSEQALVLRSCTNTGSITANARQIGGVLGFAAGRVYVESCVNHGDVTARQEAGGLIGQTDYYQSNAQGSTVYACVNTGTVTITTANTNVGEMAGGILARACAGVTLTDCINYGRMYSTSGKGVVGAIVGSSQTKDTADSYGAVVIDRCANYGVIDGVARDTSDSFASALVGGWNGGCMPAVTASADKASYDVHILGYQVTAVNTGTNTQSLRIVATIDSLDYLQVGFVITVRSGDTVVAQVSREAGSCKFVYRELAAVGQNGSILAEAYRPDGYLFALTIADIPVGDGNQTYTFEVESYAEAMDGSETVCDSTSFTHTIGDA